MENLAYCDNCRDQVEVENGYCNLCGSALGTKRCTNGHVMDPRWSECEYCSAPAIAPAVEVSLDADALEDAREELSTEGPSSGSGGPWSFDHGATILDDPGRSSEPSRQESSSRTEEDSWTDRSGMGLRSAAAPSRPLGRNRTVFDPGLGASSIERPSGRNDGPDGGRLVGWLVTFELDPAGRDFQLREGRNVIGAEQDCDVRIESEPCVSGRHAVVMVRHGEFRVRDHDSTNGTFVNGKDVFGQGAVRVGNGDRIRLGALELTLHVL